MPEKKKAATVNPALKAVAGKLIQTWFLCIIFISANVSLHDVTNSLQAWPHRISTIFFLGFLSLERCCLPILDQLKSFSWDMSFAQILTIHQNYDSSQGSFPILFDTNTILMWRDTKTLCWYDKLKMDEFWASCKLSHFLLVHFRFVTLKRKLQYVEGSLGGTVEACFCQPIDTIKTRLQLDHSGRYKGVLILSYCSLDLHNIPDLRFNLALSTQLINQIL